MMSKASELRSTRVPYKGLSALSVLLLCFFHACALVDLEQEPRNNPFDYEAPGNPGLFLVTMECYKTKQGIGIRMTNRTKMQRLSYSIIRTDTASNATVQFDTDTADYLDGNNLSAGNTYIYQFTFTDGQHPPSDIYDGCEIVY